MRAAGTEVVLWLAQGLGIGRIPWAPGTFGSLLGFVWFALLLTSGRWSVFWAGTLLGIPLSIWLAGRAETILGRTDPGSVVIDEIIAIPICFAGILIWMAGSNGALPSPTRFFAGKGWLLTLGVFVAFRFFDVVKPWPVRQSQALPGGWGVTVDDCLAALYVNVVALLCLALFAKTSD
ncbi:MAG TPA: phosphatidylglycerophosphatase A [Clostridia bacterium]|nr:phosphatidylglycerophosphatase A [Clostridia bacterium]